MATTVSIEQLANEIATAVKEYVEDVSDAIEEEVDTTADKVLREIQANSPRRHGGYAKGWKKTSEAKPGVARRIVWNKKYYRLPHLLEFGHAKVVRGKADGRVEGKAHIQPAYEKYGAPLPDHIKRIIQRGGR